MTVRVWGEPDRVRLTVQDAGPGVPAEALPRLTEPFYQVDAARSGEGNGLGLTIVDRIVQLHGGTVLFEATRPRGLCVTVDLPRPQPTKNTTCAASRAREPFRT